MEESQKNVIKIINEVKHPAIDLTLKGLGILKEVSFKEDTFFVILSLPFANIPVKDQLIESVCEPAKRLNFKCSVETTIMNEEEKQKFLKKEGQAWAGL